MKIKNWHNEGNGETSKYNKIISLLLFSVFLFNLTNQIIEEKDITSRLIYTVPYLLGAVIAYYNNIKTILSLLLLFIAYRATVGTSDPSSTTGSVFFCLSYLLMRKIKYGIGLCLFTIVLLVYRSTIHNDTIMQAITIMVGYFSIYTVFYIFACIPMIKKKSKIQTLTEDENQLLTYLAYEDISQKEAGALMELKPNKANDMLKQVREKLGVTSMYSVVRLVAEYDKSKYRKDNSRK
ncbi:MAG: hypothetical protein GY679_04385 [Mycoplasma sp.]|nr:hypothetical protein [Mycoplasma sp.]